jgi:hypothetical protein
VAPVGEGKADKDVVTYKIELPGGKKEEGTVKFGELKLIKLGMDDKGLPAKAKAEFHPARGFDLGSGKGNKVEGMISGGVVGVIIDGRGRPFNLPTDAKTRVAKLKEWMLEMDIYDKALLEKLISQY